MGDVPSWAAELAPSKLFVETGTLRGVSAHKMFMDYDMDVWTCEGSLDVYRKLFTEDLLEEGVTAVCLSSEIFLDWWFKQAYGPALLWLDARWCGPYSNTQAQPQCNLRAELGVIAHYPQRRDVILIDDAPLFLRTRFPSELDATQWPTWDEIVAALPRHDLYIRDDVIVCQPKKETP